MTPGVQNSREAIRNQYKLPAVIPAYMGGVDIHSVLNQHRQDTEQMKKNIAYKKIGVGAILIGANIATTAVFGQNFFSSALGIGGLGFIAHGVISLVQ